LAYHYTTDQKATMTLPWCHTTVLYILVRPMSYGRYMLKGNAAKWYEAYHRHINSSAADYIWGRHELLDASFPSWDRFGASLRSSFGTRLTREKVVREFEKLEHSKGIDAFLDQWTRLIWQTGYADDVVKDKISRSLNMEVS
jgi:hypothetical protein